MPNQNENEQQEEQKILPLLWQETKNAFSSKKAWMLLFFFLVLLVAGGFVPVGKIPFLRNLAYAMGYTPDETQRISFLRALFSWNEHEKILRGELPDPDAVSVFGADGGYSTSSSKAQNKLFNVRAVNAARARRGQAAEGVRGANYFVDTGDKRFSDIKIKDAKAAASTQSNMAQPSEVFFGADTSGVARDKRDGFNSVNTLKKIKNPNIAGSGSDDWMGRLVDKATRSDAGLASIAKNIDKGGMLSKLGGVQEIGESRARKDLYHAWLYGKTARRTPNPVLKKTLAAASFDNMEMPKSIFSASGFSGVGINPDDVVADMDNVKRYLQQDKECQETIDSVGDTVSDLKALARAEITQIKASFPSTCGDVASSSYWTHLSNVRNYCQQANAAYNTTLRSKCSIVVNEGSCTTNLLEDRFTSFKTYCEEEEKKCRDLITPEEQAACQAEAKAKKSEDYKDDDCPSGCGPDYINQLVGKSFNISTEEGQPPDPEASGFFSRLSLGREEEDGGSSLWLGDVD